MPSTTNFGWTTPADTDLVKDGAAAIRTLGNGVDASFVDLKGGTTGQVLAKNSNTDLDFVWTTDATGIPATIFDAKGDIIAATAADTAARLASSGVNGDVLTVDTSTSTGLKWAAATSGDNWVLLNSGGTSLSGTTTTISSISGRDKLLILINNADTNSTGGTISLRFNSDSGANYTSFGGLIFGQPTTYDPAQLLRNLDNVSQSELTLTQRGNTTGSDATAYCLITGCNSSGVKAFHYAGGSSGGTNQTISIGGGIWDNSATVSSVSVIASNTFDGGTVFVYATN